MKVFCTEKIERGHVGAMIKNKLRKINCLKLTAKAQRLGWNASLSSRAIFDTLLLFTCLPRGGPARTVLAMPPSHPPMSSGETMT